MPAPGRAPQGPTVNTRSTIDATSITLFGSEWNLQGVEGNILYLLGVGGLVLLLTVDEPAS